MRDPGRILIVSCYELGHQPLAAASAAAFLHRAGFRPRVVDLAVDDLGALENEGALEDVRLVAISVPMHTALRIGVRAARRLRDAAPRAHVVLYGLYATLNAGHLLDGIADSVIGGEVENALVGLAEALAGGAPAGSVPGVTVAGRVPVPVLERLPFPPPRRDDLPGPERYARLAVGGETRTAAAIEASRGCLHHCRHCPIPPVYGGRFFVVPREVVLEDVRALVAAGVRHVTFADPDFLNGPGHAVRIAREMHDRFPELTFDVTTKIEHVLRHRALFRELAGAGCLFVVSAVESLSDRVLEILDKGHTRRDVFAALEIVRSAGISMRPSFVSFTPWTRLEDYLDVLEWIDREGLVAHVDPVPLSIRLLVPPGSLLAERPEMRAHVVGLDQERFSWDWAHPDPRMDALHARVSRIVGRAALDGETADETFERVRAAAHDAGSMVPPRARRDSPRRWPPRSPHG